MNRAPSPYGIGEMLSRARSQLNTPFGSHLPMPVVPLENRQIKSAVKNLLERKAELLNAVPALKEVRDWVKVHWDVERETQPPENTISIGDEWGNQCGAQMDPLAAACKLLLATLGHGVEKVAKCAVDFSDHGMIEVRSFYLFKGASISNAKALDEHCALVPYKEALHTLNWERDKYPIEGIGWPPEKVHNVCALEAKSFKHPLASNTEGQEAETSYSRRVSPLLRCGPELFGLVLGLTWGTGHRTFGYCHRVAPVVSATLPFFHAGPEGGGVSQVLLGLSDLRQPSIHRPLNNLEVSELVNKFAALPERTRRIVGLALRRLRDSTERIELEDRVVDLGIALEALFSKGSEDIRETISARASWHFSDSSLERTEINKSLRDFYDERSHIVHGNVSTNLERGMKRRQRRSILLADIDNVVRTSLKTMIFEGMPLDWNASMDSNQVRRDPLRVEADIPSIKSDSLSWSIREQKDIDIALESVWRPEIDSAPSPQPDATSISHQGISATRIQQCRQQEIPFVISVPIRLFWAHPKWPEEKGDQLDERTKYYCAKDVERHLERWREAAAEMKMYQFTLPLEHPDRYLPERFDMWRQILSQSE